MSPNETLPPIAALPADASQATRDAARSIYAKHGYSDDALNAAFGTGAPAGQPKAPAGVVIPGTNISVAPGPDDGLTAEQRDKLAETLRVHWTGDPAALEQAIAGKEVAPDVEAGERYSLNYGAYAQAVPPDELAELDAMFQTGLRNASIPQAHAQPIMQAMLDSAAKYENLDDVQAKLEHAHQGALIRRVAGDNVDEFMRVANAALIAMGKDIHDTLLEHKALMTAEVWVALYNAGKANEAKAKK